MEKLFKTTPKEIFLEGMRIKTGPILFWVILDSAIINYNNYILGRTVQNILYAVNIHYKH